MRNAEMMILPIIGLLVVFIAACPTHPAPGYDAGLERPGGGSYAKAGQVGWYASMRARFDRIRSGFIRRPRKGVWDRDRLGFV